MSYGGTWRITSPSGEVITERFIADWPNTTDHSPPDELMSVLAAFPAGAGWTLNWSAEVAPGTPWSREARARERRRRLRVRLERRCPMFASQFYAEELAARPKYFAGVHPFYDAGRPGGPPVVVEEQLADV
jgi:hypothetical protein